MTPLQLALVVVLDLAILLAVYVVGYVRGCAWGTTDTERRWSDAVARADQERARQQANRRAMDGEMRRQGYAIPVSDAAVAKGD